MILNPMYPTRCSWLSRPRFLVTLLAAGLVSMALGGCNGRTSSKSPKQKTSNPAAAAKRSDDLLNSAWDMLQPNRLGISALETTVMGVLSQWATASGTISSESAGADSSLMEGHLSEAQLKRLRAERFDGRDAEHIRNCIWYRTTIENIGQDAASELDRIVDLFYYVVRTVDLVGPGRVIAQSPFDVGLLGKGTPESRAWLFANLLRQIRVDAVILQTKKTNDVSSSAASSPWCVGVLFDKQVYLFDTRLGLPIPSSAAIDSIGLIRQPATLGQAVADDGVLRRLDIDKEHPYPLDSERLRTAEVKLIGTVSLWAPRMLNLQLSLSGQRSTIVYDSLLGSEVGPGQIQRIAEFEGADWERDRISIWHYPEEQISQSEQLDTSQQDALRAQRHSLDAPRTIVQVIQQVAIRTKQGERIVGILRDQTSTSVKVRVDNREVEIPFSDFAAKPDLAPPKLEFGPPERKQLKARTTHLLSDQASAIMNYLNIRLWSKFPPTLEGVEIPIEYEAAYLQLVPPEIIRMHRKAAEDATYWMAVCQFEQGADKYSNAAETLNGYLSRYPDGAWMAMCHYLRALIFARTGKPDEAVEELSEFNRKYSSDPRHDGYEVLIRHWKARVPNPGN